jgi:hypothetical protein
MGQGSTRSDAFALRALIDLTRLGNNIGLRAQGKGRFSKFDIDIEEVIYLESYVIHIIIY